MAVYNGLAPIHASERLVAPLAVDAPDIRAEAIQNRVSVIRARFIKCGILTAAGMQAGRVGGVLFEHGVAYYTYAHYAPKSLFAQYFYANAAHEAAMQILNYPIMGVTASSLVTASFSLLTGLLVAKLGAGVYNLCVEKERRVSLSLIGAIGAIFSSVFGWLFKDL